MSKYEKAASVGQNGMIRRTKAAAAAATSGASHPLFSRYRHVMLHKPYGGLTRVFSMDPETVNDTPRPLPSIKDYTDQEVEERLACMERIAKRDLTERSKPFVKLYQSAAADALAEKTAGLKDVWLEFLQSFEKFGQSNIMIGADRSGADKSLEEKLIRLKQLEYYDRYGDYLARETTNFRKGAEEMMTEGHEQFR